MIKEILTSANWIDILVVILLIRTTYVGIKHGLAVEFFKLTAIIITIFISLHYFQRLAEFISGRTAIPIEFSQIVSLLFIVLILQFTFRLIRIGAFYLLKVEAREALDKWAGAVIGILRGLILTSLLLVIFVFTNLTYLKGSIKDSFSGVKLTQISPNIYKFIFNGIISKFFPEEEINDEAIYLWDKDKK